MSEREKLLLRAVRECAASYQSPECTMGEGFVHLSREFKRRMAIAAEALEAALPHHTIVEDA